MRYIGEQFSVSVPIDGRGARWLATTTTAFHTLHERLYGFSVPDEPVEVVNVRLRAIGRLHRNERDGTARNGGSAHRAEPVATRLVGFGPGKDDRCEVPVYARETLVPCTRFAACQSADAQRLDPARSAPPQCPGGRLWAIC
jgi:N-methylhydantoinase A